MTPNTARQNRATNTPGSPSPSTTAASTRPRTGGRTPARCSTVSSCSTSNPGNVADSLRKGDAVIVAGDLRFGTYTDKETGQTRETRDVVADNVGASLKFADVDVERTPKANGPAATAYGADSGTGLVRRYRDCPLTHLHRCGRESSYSRPHRRS